MALVPIRISVPLPDAPTGREVLAFAHRARRTDPQAEKRAALFFNPYGQEAIRTHRLMRVAADRLARQGVDVLRFDFFGTGDSPGTDEQADISGWTADAMAAHQMLADVHAQRGEGAAERVLRHASAALEHTDAGSEWRLPLERHVVWARGLLGGHDRVLN